MVKTRRRIFQSASGGRKAKDRRGWLGRDLRRDLPVRQPGSHRTSILFINQYYWPDHASTAQHLTDLAERMAAEGFACRVLAGAGKYEGRFDSSTKQSAGRETRNGVEVVRVGSTSLGRTSTLARMIDYLSFLLGAVWCSLSLPRHDVVVTLTTPPMLGLIGSLLKLFKKSKHIYWCMDLHPDAGIALGKMSARNPVVALLEHMNRVVLRFADEVVVLGPYMAAKSRAKGVRPSRISVAPVWSRREEIYPLPRKGHPLRSQLGLEDKFVLLYSGNLGLAHSFDEFLEAARRLVPRSEIVFLFVGAGPRRKEVEQAAAAGLPNVRLLDYFPREQLHASLSLADVHLISMRQEMTGIVVPSKLYGAMASARPAIFVGPERCESGDAIREGACGWLVPPGDVDRLVETIEEAVDNPLIADALGSNARESFLENFDAEVCLAEWVRLVGELAAPSKSEQPVRSYGGSQPNRRTPITTREAKIHQESRAS